MEVDGDAPAAGRRLWQCSLIEYINKVRQLACSDLAVLRAVSVNYPLDDRFERESTTE
jgi:hypothetical protein